MSFKIHGEVSLDGAMFKRGLSEIGGETTAFLKNFALGAIGIASVEQAFEKTIDSAKELVNTSKKLDVTVEQLQVMRQAAEDNGQEFDVMSKALERFNSVRENILTGGKGSGDQLAALKRLGITPDQLRDQTAAQSLMGQISATAQHSNAADIANDLKTVFGRNGEELFGVLKTKFSDLEGEMKKYGELMDTQTAVTLKNFSDEMGLIDRILITTFAPALLQLAQFMIWYALQIKTSGEFTGNFIKDLAKNLTSLRGVLRLMNPLTQFSTIGKSLDRAASQTDVKSNDAIFDEFIKKIAEMTNALDHPRPPSPNPGSGDDNNPKKNREASHGIKSDSLIESGNFLGSNANSLQTIAQQHLEVSRKIYDKLTDIDNKISSNGGGTTLQDPFIDFGG